MITLKHVWINKYKSFETPQHFSVEDKVTILVGKNEAGKTGVLEAIAKTNYFEKDSKFTYNPTHDYPRKEKKKLDKSGENPIVVTCQYNISKSLLGLIKEDIGDGTFAVTQFKYSKKYDNSGVYEGIAAQKSSFIDHIFKTHGLTDAALKEKLLLINNANELAKLQSETTEENTKKALTGLSKYYENSWKWENDPISEYIARKWISPNLPKFLYYDEYYALPSRINIHDLQNASLEQDDLKTSRALFELADINIAELVKSNDFEAYMSELEATSNEITQQLFKYWTTNKDLRIRFQIDKQYLNNQPTHILDIRVENLKHLITLPLKNRSKGFNWFFSFIVWFSKIQEDKKSNYVLLLDEPGLNLHASAQADLMNFIEDLSADYQVIYTTHSPFMVNSDHLERVRTVLETDNGSQISDSIQEKDSDTLFPLQAALGYDIAQNLFISKNNLLVEGPADLIYLTVLSTTLQGLGRTGLKDGITIVPVGGLDKVATFISLLKASKLNIVCLLDTFSDVKGKQRVDDLIRHKIIKEKNIRFFHEFANNGSDKADMEDMFAKDEYVSYFNAAFDEHPDIIAKDLDPNIKQIVGQINKFLKIDRFNHYRPANKLAQTGTTNTTFSIATLDRFETLFKEINKLY